MVHVNKTENIMRPVEVRKQGGASSLTLNLERPSVPKQSTVFSSLYI